MKQLAISLQFAVLSIIKAGFAFGQDTNAVKISQDPQIETLMERQLQYNASRQTTDGYRVQIKSLTGTNSKKLANDIKADFLLKFPDMDAYIVYLSPNFKVRVGDFRTKLEAQKFHRTIKAEFPSAFPIKDEINLPKLD